MSEFKELGRRAFLGALGASAGIVLARPSVFKGLSISAAGSSHSELSFSELLQGLIESLTPVQQAHTVLDVNDPIRQITNTVAVHKGPHIGTLFSAHQVGLIRQLYNAMLSSQGQSWFKNTTALEGKFEGASLKIYSDKTGAYQLVINGGHFMLRSDNDAHQGNNAYAFGGPISYGQQLGNNRFMVEGNAFKAHGDAVNAVHQAMSESERARAYRVSPPSELLMQIQGKNANLQGIKIGSASEVVQALARQAINTIFAAYPEHQQSEAWSAIDDNGGLESLHLTLFKDYGFYEDGSVYTELTPVQQEAKGLPYIQVWRIEGPACVIHFQGYPHVHAYINVVRDPNRVAVGEVLNEIPSAFNEVSTRALLQTALKLGTGEALSYYPNLILGRLSPGAVSTGSLYALDPFANSIVIATLRSEMMSAPLKANLQAQGVAILPGQSTRIATIDYMLQRPDLFGEPDSIVETGVSMRSALINTVRDRDLTSLLAHG